MDITTLLSILANIILSIGTLVTAYVAFKKLKQEVNTLRANETDIYATASKKIAESSEIMLKQLKDEIDRMKEENKEKAVKYEKLEKDYSALLQEQIRVRSENEQIRQELAELNKENCLYRKWNTWLTAQLTELGVNPVPMPKNC